MADHAFLLHGVEARLLEHIGLQARDLVGVGRAGKAQPCPRHLQCRGQHALVHDAHRRGGLGHAIDMHQAALVARRAARRGVDRHALRQRQVLVLLDKAEHRRLAQTFQEHRFMMGQHLHVDEPALGVDGHQQVDRHAGKARHRREIDRLERIADQFDGGRILAQQRPYRQRRILLAHHQRRREMAGQRRLRHDAGRSRQGSQRQQQPQPQRGRRQCVALTAPPTARHAWQRYGPFHRRRSVRTRPAAAPRPGRAHPS
jgi:hypothetical protein